MRLLPGQQLELAALLGGHYINAGLVQSRQTFVA
jgi:hypothetical protein